MPASTARDTAQYLIFQVANQPCAAPLNEIAEIALMAELSPPFGPSEILAGLLNVGGEALPILHLNWILNLKDSASTLYSHILLVKTEAGTLGFLIEAAKEILNVSRSEIRPLKAEAKPFSSTMIPYGKNFVGAIELRRAASYFERNLSGGSPPELSLPTLAKAAS